MKDFLHALRIQRWDDHRYYHHSRINQSLHLISAMSFLVAYALLFSDPAMAALLAWLVSMVSRQAGHFFFEGNRPATFQHPLYSFAGDWVMFKDILTGKIPF